MLGTYIFLVLLVFFSFGEYQQLRAESKDADEFTGFSDITLPEFGIVMNQRGYAYVIAAMIMILFVAVVYCHIASVRSTRLLEQYQQQLTLSEWSPLLIGRKNVRPPPPYEQVV